MCKSLLLLAVLTVPVHGAETGLNYSFPDAGFTAPFPGKPALVERSHPTSQSPSGSVKDRLYSADQGGVIYSVEIMDFRGKGADSTLVIAEATRTLTGLGRLAFDQSSYIDQIYGHHLVVIGVDGTRHSATLFYLKDQLFQIKVTSPRNNLDPAGSSGIIRFLAGFQFLDPF